MILQRVAWGALVAIATALACRPRQEEKSGGDEATPSESEARVRRYAELIGKLETTFPRCLTFKAGKITPEERTFCRNEAKSLTPEMLRVLDRVDPKEIARLFREAAAIPSPSGHEEAYANWMIEQWKKLALGAHQDDALERFAALLPKRQKELYCDGKNPPEVGNVVFSAPPNFLDSRRISFFLSTHLDTLEDPDLTVVERGGRLYSDGNSILGADDKGGFVATYHALALALNAQIPHGGIYFRAAPCEESTQFGNKFTRNEDNQGDVGLVVDAMRTDAIYNAGPDIYFADFSIDGTKVIKPRSDLPHQERFSLAFQGAPYHPAFADKAISATNLGIQTLKEMKTLACGTVRDHDDVQAVFRFQGGSLKKGSTPERPEIGENGNRIPLAARIDFLLLGKTPEEVADYKRRLLKTAAEVVREANQASGSIKKAAVSMIHEPIGEAPKPRNASAVIANAMRLMDLQWNNAPGADNQDVRFQVNQVIAESPTRAVGSWQLRSGNPAKTEPMRKKWGENLALVTGAFGGKYKEQLLEGGRLLPGYSLPETDPAIQAVLGGYALAGLPRPRLEPTFGGSNVNHLVANGDREAIVLVGYGGDFIHSNDENFDPEDAANAARVILGVMLVLSQYKRVDPSPIPHIGGVRAE